MTAAAIGFCAFLGFFRLNYYKIQKIGLANSGWKMRIY